MLNRFAALAACTLIPLATAPMAVADPPADDPGPPPDTGVVASGDPAVVTSPDGWVLTVAAKDETQLPVAPLTTAVSSREYLVGGTFTGTVTGSGKTTLSGGVLEAGYQIGCGIELGQVRLIGQVGVTTAGSTRYRRPGPDRASTSRSRAPSRSTPSPAPCPRSPSTRRRSRPRPVRVTLKDTHIKVDGCVGQSFLRSYATLTSSTTDTDDVVAYYGVTKAV